ncbi:MAG: hypothetical protein JJ896_02720 [Rhodothermales bacterium]|nr:hypothetical protein [Rhodothermales bacterium]MBO6778544.1 hypothetical protein [Rhodothermales bacterium]
MKILTVGRERASEVSDLRVRAYSRGTNLRQPDYSWALWNDSDDAALVMVCEINGSIVSTMRLQVLADHAQLADSLSIPKYRSLHPAPFGVLGRGATHQDYGGQGLSMRLRLALMKRATGAGVRTLVGRLAATSRRLRFLEDIGYEVSPLPSPKVPGIPFVIAQLDLDKYGDSAAARIAEAILRAPSQK